MYVLILEFNFLGSFFCCIFMVKIFRKKQYWFYSFLPITKILVHTTLSLTCDRLVLLNWWRWKSTERIRSYVVNSRYMLNIRLKLFKNDSSAYHPLRFTQGCGIDQMFIILKYVYLIAKYSTAGFMRAFNYCKKLLFGISLVMLWLD